MLFEVDEKTNAEKMAIFHYSLCGNGSDGRSPHITPLIKHQILKLHEGVTLY